MKTLTRMYQNQAILLTCLGILTLASRLPFRPDILINFDAINYSLAISHYDVRLSQPQAPGYLLYILIARGINQFVNNPLNTLYLESAIFSALAVVAIYLAGREIYNQRVGVFAAVFLATNVFFWYYSVIPAPYTGDFFLSVVIGWLCYRLLKTQSTWSGLLTAVCLGLAAGYRPQTFFLLLPLFLHVLWCIRSKPIVSGVSLMVCFCLASIFFVIPIMISGGKEEYLNSVGDTVPIFKNTYYFTRIMLYLPRYANNLRMIFTYMVRSMGELLCVLTLVGFLFRPNKLRFWKDQRLIFLFLWVIPTWMAYFLIWPGNPGTILVCTPPIFILAAFGMDQLIQSARLRPLAMTVFIGILVAQTMTFTIFPIYPLGNGYRYFENWNSIKFQIARYKDRISLVKQLPVDGTLIYAIDIRHLQYYLPEYKALSFPQFQKNDSSQIASILLSQNGSLLQKGGLTMQELLPANIYRVVLFDISPLDTKADPALFAVHSQNGHNILVLNILPGECPDWTADGLTLIKCRK
jgi:hypothetical protein